ncbi:DnaB-like helicase N-terminal domain-containing protein [Aureimonas altamirensis]|uniref:DnaB-like helicase N-terminal domain-containing protein n=1 Tax=Aureimonas altamirensis TaxID=370622 RepID=UPI00057D1925|nr:DnaB-like helicase N-terminal domain-containing protein [Aureimonas altamirensis]
MNAHDLSFRDFAPADQNLRPELMDATNIDAEQSVLGAVMMDNALIGSRLPFLEPEHFSEQFHQKLFTHILGLVDRGKRADPVTLMPEYRNHNDIGDITACEYIARLVSECNPGNVRDHAVVILEMFGRRKAAMGLHECADAFLHPESGELFSERVAHLDDLAAELRTLAPRQDSRSFIGAYIDGALAKLSDPDRHAAASIPFPLPEIGSILQEDGWSPGNLYGLVGASGEGKTSLMLQIVRAAAEASHPVLLLSYDQNGEQAAMQMVSQRTGVTYSAIRRRGCINDHEASLLDEERRALHKLPIEIKRMKTEKIGRICGIAQGFAKSWSKRVQPNGEPYKAPLIILDHNRKVTPDRPNDHEGRIAGSINGAGKALAEEIGAAVLFICQRNGGGLRRDVPRPIAADLFGGEQSREDFDAILYIYRAEHWQNEKLKVASSASEEDKIRARFLIGGKSPEDKAELGALKVRYGRSDLREIVGWEGRLTRYVSLRQTERELF